MKKKSSQDLILKNWALVNNLAQENPSLLIHDGAKYTDVCASRMSELEFWENELVAVLKPEHSKQAEEWLKAREDKGCMQCWISSIRGGTHPECQKKISAYFRSVENLIDLGISI